MDKSHNSYPNGQKTLFDGTEDMAIAAPVSKPPKESRQKTKPVTLSMSGGAVQYANERDNLKGHKPVFVVDDDIRKKYPFIRHQPAVLMDYRNIVDVIVRDGDAEYWVGIDRYGNEVLVGSIDKKIPEHLKDCLREYIDNLKVF